MGSIVFAIVSTFLGGHVGHDGGHFAVSRIPIVNDVAVWFISGVSNPMTWQHQHTYAHHSHTNVCDHDPDLHHFNQLMRLSRREPLSALRKKQAYAVYVFFAFTVTCFATCFRFPWRFVIERSMHGVVGWSDRQRFIRTLGLFFHLITYTALVGIIPFFVHKSAWSAFLSVLAHVITCGFLFACVSQVGHLTENKLNRDIDKQRLKRGGVAVNSWAANQIEATNDFCPQSTLSFYLFGGLGLQIEHHLFPSLNHCHLQLIQPVVEKTCQEFNVEYTSYDSWMDVMKDTLTLFRNLAYDLE